MADENGADSAMVDTLTRHGEVAHGGDAEGAAIEWEQAGMTPEQADAWLDARCFDADAAARLAAAGITAEQAAERTDAGLGGYADTIGYKVANTDLDVADAVELTRGEVR